MLRATRSSRREPITVGIVKEAEWCPRYAWLVWNSCSPIEETPSMSLARGKVDMGSVARSLGLEEPVLVEPALCDEELGLCGRPDLVAGSRRRTVVEVKAFDRVNAAHFAVQARVYALLVNRTLGRVRRYALVLGDRVMAWDYTEWDERDAEARVRRARRIVESPSPPDPLGNGKCAYCQLRRVCSPG